VFDALKGDRFSVNEKVEHRKLLWHGTNVAVVAAILKSGLRIMPHSGGRVGRGIYFASENAKSAGYGKTRELRYYICGTLKGHYTLVQSEVIRLFVPPTSSKYPTKFFKETY